MAGQSRPKDGVASLAQSRPKDGVASLASARPSTSCLVSRMAGGWVYFTTNRRNVGVTSVLPKRAYNHREGLVDGFTRESLDVDVSNAMRHLLLAGTSYLLRRWNRSAVEHGRGIRSSGAALRSDVVRTWGKVKSMESERNDRLFTDLLGAATLHLWADLPRDVQAKLFEHAVVTGHRSERDESLRERLAKFLHDRHKRTQQA
jgi:hypothetical protein